MLGSILAKLLAVGKSKGRTLEVSSSHRLLMRSRMGPPQSSEPSLIMRTLKGVLVFFFQRTGFFIDFMNCVNIVQCSVAVSNLFFIANSLALTLRMRTFTRLYIEGTWFCIRSICACLIKSMCVRSIIIV